MHFFLSPPQGAVAAVFFLPRPSPPQGTVYLERIVPMNRIVSDPVCPWQEEFVRMLPAIQTHAKISFRRLYAGDREESIANATALACMGFESLARRNRLGKAYPSALADFAVRATRSGRVAGSGQSSKDALSRLAQKRRGFAVHRLPPEPIETGWERRIPAPWPTLR